MDFDVETVAVDVDIIVAHIFIVIDNDTNFHATWSAYIDFPESQTSNLSLAKRSFLTLPATWTGTIQLKDEEKVLWETL